MGEDGFMQPNDTMSQESDGTLHESTVIVTGGD